MKDLFGMIFAAVLDFKWWVLGVLFGALFVGAVIDARAETLDEPHCTGMAVVADAAAQMRDRGDPEKHFHDILDEAFKTTPHDAVDYPSPTQIKVLHALAHLIYTTPTIKAGDIGQKVYDRCMKSNEPKAEPNALRMSVVADMPPQVLNPPQCETVRDLMGAIAGARDHGITEDMAQDILDKANKGAEDELPDAALPFLHLMVHRIYEHPEWSPDAVSMGNYSGCMKVWKKYHPNESAPPPKEEPWTPFSYGKHNI